MQLCYVLTKGGYVMLKHQSTQAPKRSPNLHTQSTPVAVTGASAGVSVRASDGALVGAPDGATVSGALVSTSVGASGEPLSRCISRCISWCISWCISRCISRCISWCINRHGARLRWVRGIAGGGKWGKEPCAKHLA